MKIAHTNAIHPVKISMKSAGFIHITIICYTNGSYLLTTLCKWLNQPSHQQTLVNSTDFNERYVNLHHLVILLVSHKSVLHV